MKQEQVRSVLRDIHSVIHELAWHRDEESEHIKNAKIALVKIYQDIKSELNNGDGF